MHFPHYLHKRARTNYIPLKMFACEFSTFTKTVSFSWPGFFTYTLAWKNDNQLSLTSDFSGDVAVLLQRNSGTLVSVPAKYSPFLKSFKSYGS